MKTVKLAISGMHCTSCAMSIDGELEDLEGVKEAKTSYAKQEAEVTFDENKVTPKEMVNAIQSIDDAYNATVAK